MPSSTFNSDELRLPSPAKNWLAVWGMTLAFAAAILGGAEAFWRSQGHRPTVTDSDDLWSSLRAQVSDGSANHVVLIGWSRIQMGISLDTFRQRFPQYTITQLAIAGRTPIATLRDLADDEDFRGTVICEITSYGIGRRTWEQQQPYVEHYRTMYRPYDVLTTWLTAWPQQYFVVLKPETRLDKLAKLLFLRKELPEAPWSYMRNDRYLFADFEFADLDKLDELANLFFHQRTGKIPKPQEWLADVRDIEQMVQRIKQRGGQVVFAEFSATGDYRDREDKFWPKAEFWDKMAENTSAVTINLRDVPSLSAFKLPDNVHLNSRDAAAFTDCFLDELVKRGVLSKRK